MDQQQIEISGPDTSPGIPSEDLPFIFDHFWRGDKSSARTSGGSGIGLAIAKKLVELDGGKIRAESCEGKGSTFLLPSLGFNLVGLIETSNLAEKIDLLP